MYSKIKLRVREVAENIHTYSAAQVFIIAVQKMKIFYLTMNMRTSYMNLMVMMILTLHPP